MNIEYSKRQLQQIIISKKIMQMKKHISENDTLFIIEQAKLLQQHIFTFDKPWDMERCLLPFCIEPLNFHAQRNDDEEWCFMLNRMDYLNYLMLADLLSEQSGYAQAGKEIILTWIAQHSLIQPEVSTRTLDTGIRIMNIMEALPYLLVSQHLNDEELTVILESLEKQIHYLKDKYIAKYTLSNWGSIQTCAILSVLPLLDEQYEEHPIYKWAMDEIKVQFSIQIYEDGMHWEQSTMYHVEVLNYAMKLVYYHRHYEIPLAYEVENGCYKLCDSLCYQMTPKGEIEAFGDSDRCSIKDVLTRGASLFQQSFWKFNGYEVFDIESLYTFGYEVAINYQSLASAQPKQLCFDGIDSGMYGIRSGWDNKASFTMFTHGSLGSGHGHSDNLHVSVYFEGEPYLIDTGRYTYREDQPLRTKLKGMKAHNSVLIDENEYCLPKDSWRYERFGQPLKAYVQHKEHLHYLEGSMIGAHPLQIWTRKLIIIDPSIWMFIDEVKQDGEHTMMQRFHLDPSITTREIPRGFVIGQLKILNSHTSKSGIEPCSLRYNELQQHAVITCSQVFQGKGSAITSFCPKDMLVEVVPIFQNKDTLLAPTIAQARKYHLSKQESYTIVIFHEEVYQGSKICFCEGVAIHAKAVVIHTVNDKKKSYRLRT